MTSPSYVHASPRARAAFLHPDVVAENDGGLPLILTPVRAELDLAEWIAGNRSRMEQWLATSGAILFRGFAVRSIPDFERCARAICSPLFGEYGDLPKEPNGESVYHSTPYPADKHILFHNEASHTSRWPMKQWFYCALPAQTGGETPIVDCRRIYQALDADLAEQFTRKQLRYVRNFIEGLDVSWQDFFKTTSRMEVEARCAAANMKCEWVDGGQLRVSNIAPAVLRHPRTHELTFFNQIQLHHTATLDPKLRSSLVELFGEEGVPRNVLFGDGSPIPNDVVQQLLDLYWKQCVASRWEAHDILLVDNMLVAHARNPFGGPRKIVVAMGEMVSKDQFAY